jgi:hypothetical protein
MKYRVEITKCYLVQVFDENDNELARNLAYVNTKKEAENRGALLLKSVQARDLEFCKCGYCDCIFNTDKYKNICNECIEGSEYDDEDK